MSVRECPLSVRHDPLMSALSGQVKAVRRRYALLTIAAFALLLVPTATALRDRIVNFFQGTPPPRAVSNSFAANNRLARMAIQKGFPKRFPQADVTRAHGVLETATIYGPQDVWVAPNDEGGSCWWVAFANDEPMGRAGVQPGYGTCDRGQEEGGSIDVIGPTWDEWHPKVRTLFGLVHVHADHVVVDLKDGSTQTLPVVEGAYLASLDREAKLERITAYENGARVATWDAPTD
jgi:hypothetical protein